MSNNEKSWYSDQKGRVIENDNFLSLYTRYHESMDDALNRHFNVRNYYTVLLSALTGLYVGGLLQLEISILQLETINTSRLSMPYFVLLIIPIAVIFLSIIAIFSTTRYYTAWLRRVVLIAKIENILGVDRQIKTKTGKPEEIVWRNDERFMDEDYCRSRKNFKSSREFIARKKWKGDNKWALLTFVAFCVFGLILTAIHIYFLWY